MAKDCKCGMPGQHARATASAVFNCLLNAMSDRENESLWFQRADTLEIKFKTGHGQHYSLLTKELT